MRLLLLSLFLGVISGFVSSADSQRDRADELIGDLYNDCDKRNKRCFGDNDACIQSRNCTFAISISENRTTFTIITLNRCFDENQIPSQDFFVGVGLNTLDSAGNRECREPTFEDFKGFIFWNNNKKCERKTYFDQVTMAYKTKEYWVQNCKYNQTIHGAEPNQARFELARYLSRYIIRGTDAGDKAPFKFADRMTDYVVRNGIFFRNRVQPPEEPQEPMYGMGQSSQTQAGNSGSGMSYSSSSGHPQTPEKALDILAEIYRDCNGRSKRCYGDSDVCLQFKNCTFAISIAETKEHFRILTTNGCYEQNKGASPDVFVGVGLNTLDSQGNRECREPRMDDFKSFIFWNNNEKCHKKTYAFEVNVIPVTKQYWLHNCQYNKTLHGPGPNESRFELSSYLSRNLLMRSAVGDKPPFKFADKVDYTVKDGNFYINRVQPAREPPEVLFEQRRPGDASSQSQQGGSTTTTADASLTKFSYYFSIPLVLVSLLRFF